MKSPGDGLFYTTLQLATAKSSENSAVISAHRQPSLVLAANLPKDTTYGPTLSDSQTALTAILAEDLET